MDAPFDNQDYEIWCLNWNTPKYSRVTLDFEIHTMRNNKAVIPEKHGVPTITQENFPHQWIADNFPRYLNDTFYKSSLDYMLAYALYKHKIAKTEAEKVDLVSIHGVQMSVNDDEYFKQQPSFHAWIGFCLAHFDVVIDDHSPLMKSTFTYGLGDVISADPLYNSAAFHKMAKDQDAVVRELEQELALIKDKIHTHNGTRQAWELLAKVERARIAGQRITRFEDFVQAIK
jgi:hypothetical protein